MVAIRATPARRVERLAGLLLSKAVLKGRPDKGISDLRFAVRGLDGQMVLPARSEIAARRAAAFHEVEARRHGEEVAQGLRLAAALKKWHSGLHANTIRDLANGGVMPHEIQAFSRRVSAALTPREEPKPPPHGVTRIPFDPERNHKFWSVRENVEDAAVWDVGMAVLEGRDMPAGALAAVLEAPPEIARHLSSPPAAAIRSNSNPGRPPITGMARALLCVLVRLGYPVWETVEQRRRGPWAGCPGFPPLLRKVFELYGVKADADEYADRAETWWKATHPRR